LPLFRSRRSAAPAVVFALFAACAGAAAAQPAQSPACSHGAAGQRELRPLQPLTLVTGKGRFRFQVEDADTDRKRATGLMCRVRLTADRGMLFDFRRPTGDVAFWMRDTLIPLDIVFIRPDGRVLSIAHNARPLDETPLPAGGEIRGVLEIAGGRAAQIGLLPGDRVVHRIFRP
jgi:uncharacterized membrane protein (UPF0127 family)